MQNTVTHSAKPRTHHFGQIMSLLMLLVKRDLKVRYRGSFLGYLWSMLNPLLTMTVLTVVFTYAMRVQMDYYALYILSGLLCWNTFAQSAQLGTYSLIYNASLLKKVSVPPWVFPTATIGSAMIHSCFALVPYFAISAYMQFPLSLKLLQLPLVFVLFFFFIQGIVLVLATINVFFRDVGHVIEPVLQLVFYCSPILYPIHILPEKFQWLIKLNPITHYLKGFRSSLYLVDPLSVKMWLVLTALSLVSFTVGWWCINRTKNEFIFHL